MSLVNPDHNEEQHMQHERRFATLDREIAGVKTDVGILQADVKTLAAGQAQMQQSQDRGFKDIKDMIVGKAKEPPKIGVPMLLSLFGVLTTVVVMGVGAFWAAVLLLANPITDDLDEHKNTKSHGHVSADVALLQERSNMNRAAIEDAVDELHTDMDINQRGSADVFARLYARLDALEDSRVITAERLGADQARLSMLEQVTMDLRERLGSHAEARLDKSRKK